MFPMRITRRYLEIPGFRMKMKKAARQALMAITKQRRKNLVLRRGLRTLRILKREKTVLLLQQAQFRNTETNLLILDLDTIDNLLESSPDCTKSAVEIRMDGEQYKNTKVGKDEEDPEKVAVVVVAQNLEQQGDPDQREHNVGVGGDIGVPELINL